MPSNVASPAQKTWMSRPVLPVTAEWIRELSAERYRPMLRLLDDSDIRFLCRQPGFNQKMAARLRRQRCRIFASYLRSMQEDFRKVCHALRIVMVNSACDRPDMAAVLARKQVTFRMLMLRARWRLFLYRRGNRRVDVSPLMNLFGNVCAELQGCFPKPREAQLALVLPRASDHI